MQREELVERLGKGEIVVLETANWTELAPSFEVREQHATQLKGSLWIIETPTGLAAVEEPHDAERVVRPLADPMAAKMFVEERLATYDRMWDGCGCKVEYYK